MRILHLLSQRPDSTGSGISLQALLRESAARGHRNGVLAGLPPGPEPRLEGVAAPDCRYVRFEKDLPHPIVGMSDVMPYPSVRFRDLTAPQVAEYRRVFGEAIGAVLDEFRPDLIHSHHLWLVTALAVERAAAHPTRPRVVAQCHGSDLRQYRQCHELADLVREPCRRLDAVFALCRAQKNDIAWRYGVPAARIHVVGAGYNEQLFRPGEKAPTPPVQLVYAGKLSRAKGVPWLLKALAEIDAPAWRLHLVGDGTGREKEECLELAAALGDRVVTHGSLPQSRLAEILRRAHLFVLPSLYEGLPLVLLEALACGCRLAATELPGVREVLGDLDARLLEMIPLPEMKDVDTPRRRAEEDFVTGIRAGLLGLLDRAARGEEFPWEQARGRLAEFTWGQVYGRIDRALGA